MRAKHFFILLVLFFALSATVTAAEPNVENTECYQLETELFPDLRRPAPETSDTPMLSAANDPYERLKESILDGVRKKQTRIDLDNSLVIGSNIEGKFAFIQKAYHNTAYHDPEAFAFISEAVFWRSGETVWWLELTYDETESGALTAAIDAACAACFTDGMTDLEKIVVAHDWLAANCQYDPCVSKGVTTFTAEDGTVYNKTDRVYTLRGVFIDRNAVCQGYALGFQALMKRAGIRSCYVSSSEINHAWNLVELDGKWYQIDVTWDDPVADCPGRANRRYMLKSDSTFENHPDGSNHTGWTTEYSYVCEQDFSDEGFSSLESTPVFLYNHRLYGIRTLSGVGTCFCAYPLGSQFSAKQVEKSIKLKTNTYLASAFDQQRGFFFYLDWFYARIDGVSTLVIGIFSLQLNLPEWEFALFQQIPTSNWKGMMISGNQLYLRYNYANVASFDLPQPVLLSTDPGMPLALQYIPDLSLETLAGKPITVLRTDVAPVEEYTVYFACYRANGKLISVVPVSVTGDCFTVPVPLPKGCDYAKLLVIGAQSDPLAGMLKLVSYSS